MNFVAIIGIVEKVDMLEKSNRAKVTVKVEKPFVESKQEAWYDIVTVELDDTIFKKEIDSLTKGDIVGIKGRIMCENASALLIGERVQVF